LAGRSGKGPLTQSGAAAKGCGKLEHAPAIERQGSGKVRHRAGILWLKGKAVTMVQCREGAVNCRIQDAAA